MQLKDALPKLNKHYTVEEIEAARLAQLARNALCSPDCPHCAGAGYIAKGDGKVDVCPTLFQKRIRLNSKRYGMAVVEIDGLDWTVVRDMYDALKATKVVRTALELGYGWVYLWGTHGQAKTLLLKIAVAASLRSGIEAAYCNMAGILDNLRAAFGAEYSNESERRLEWWQGLRVLAIDEFNRVNETGWVNERRFALMDARYVQAVRQETLTLIASNEPPEKQESYLFDRIRDGRFTVVELKGASARPSMKGKFTF